MSIPYDPALVQESGNTLDLRKPNLAALDAIARHLDDAPAGTELVADLATGVGKTYILGGLLDYLAQSGIRNVVIVTPGSTIQKKTVNNLTPGHAKYLRGLRCNPMVITLDDLERGSVGAALTDDSIFKVFVFTVQSLLRPNTADARRAHRAHETLGVALYEYLQAADDLVVIADEHHVYYSGNAKAFQAAVDNLQALAVIGLTATPMQSSEPKIVFRYPLADAIADGYVKIPVLVARQDGVKDLRTQMGDGLALLEAKAAAIDAYCAQTRKEPIHPIMFVVAESIDEAEKIRDMLASPDMLGNDAKVLLVTSEEPDKTLALLDTLEDVSSPIRAVVSVSMLKEGWDVKNIYVIAAVRAMESKLLTEQILGRGLRLPFGHRTGVPMLDTVEVLSHHSFADLLKEAKVLLEQTLGQRAREAVMVSDAVAGVMQAGVPFGVPSAGAPASTSHVSFGFPAAGSERSGGDVWSDSNQGLFVYDEEGKLDEPLLEGGDESRPGMGFSTLDERLREGAGAVVALTTRYGPRAPGGVRIPLFLPRVSIRWEREPFSLTMLDEMAVEGLGRTFAHDNGATLTRKALDAERDSSGRASVIIHDEMDEVFARQTNLGFETIEIDLAQRLLASNGVAATFTEMNAATLVTSAFLSGANVMEETPWRAEHGRLATARLIEWITAQQTKKPAREVVEVTPVRWPEPRERVEARPPADRQLITSSREFTPNYPYAGWQRSVYEINAFDAYSTEFRLASLFETTAGVKAWIRVTETVPLRISYLFRQGAIQRTYEPDFIVIDDSDVHWIVEGKSNRDMTDEAVLAKQAAAIAWVAAVNASDVVAERWGYMLASEQVISAASSWAGLKSAAQVSG
jgi:type III restriction enzyme